MSKLLIFTAPSGAGKTTIVRHLLSAFDDLSFSVSATTRAKRPHEVDGKDYYFLSPEAFREQIEQKGFVEWEEVYRDQYYGTLRSEVERLWKDGKHIVFDIDVKGALTLKKAFPLESMAIFVQPPSPEALRERLCSRNTESEESLKKRLQKADEELSFANKFDKILVNDVLEDALLEAEAIVRNFINDPDNGHAHRNNERN